MRVGIVVNPNAASGRAGNQWPLVQEVLETKFDHIESMCTKRPGHAIEIARELGQRSDLVISVGGDGTHNEVVNGLMQLEQRPEWGILNMGTGGDFRKTFGISSDPIHTASRMDEAEIRTIDVGHAEYIDNDGRPAERYFMNILSAGVGGLVDRCVYRAPSWMPGKLAYFYGSLQGAIGYQNQKVTIRVDDELFYEGPLFLVSCCNGQYFGGGMQMGAGADPSDGLLDVVVQGDFGLRDKLRLARHVYDGSHLDDPKTHHIRGKKISIESSGDQVWIDLDGEAPGRFPGAVRLVPDALRLRVVVG